LREGGRLLAPLVMRGEASEQIGAVEYQLTPERKIERNAYRERDWGTPVGSIALATPKVRDGSSFPSFMEPCRRGVTGPGALS
jgi:putative transposase